MKAASTPFKKKKKQSGVWLTLLPLYLFTLVFVAGPLVYMFVLSFQTRAEVWGPGVPEVRNREERPRVKLVTGAKS